MTPSTLKSYLRERQRASLQDLVWHFHSDPEAVRGVLGHWLRKGRVRKTTAEAACGTGCCKCDPLLTEVYEWLE